MRPESPAATLQQSPSAFGGDDNLAEAIHRYQQGTISQERAAELAGMNRRDFIRTMAQKGLDVFIVTEETIAHELKLRGQ